jgi:hypothetical protein
MKTINIHKRNIHKPIAEVGPLLNSLSSKNDQLWPHENWSPMKFDRDLIEGAMGGHGPIKYTVTKFKQGKMINFEFTEPLGFQGNHWFELKQIDEKKTEITHTINMNVSGPDIFFWPIVIRPLHNALIEDSFDKLQRKLGIETQTSRWNPWVKFIRFMFKMKKSV